MIARRLVGVADQARDAVVRVRRLQDLRERYREQFQAERAAGRLLQMVDLLFARPMVTMPHIAEALGVNYATATRYIRRLEEAAILREITGQARNREYNHGHETSSARNPRSRGPVPRPARPGPR